MQKHLGMIILRALVRRCLQELSHNRKINVNIFSLVAGKFLQLHFDSTNRLSGSKCVTYLLEKVLQMN